MLGDFGIAYQIDAVGTRITGTTERVGTRDWMAPWAHTGQRFDDPSCALDVFSLGKILWALVSGEKMLPLWYHRREPHNVERRFTASGLDLVNGILDQCVVEEEEQCVQSAQELLKLVDEALRVLGMGGTTLRLDEPIACRVCGVGYYRTTVGELEDRLLSIPIKEEFERGNWDLRSVFNPQRFALTVRVCVCNHCGNVQLFNFPPEKKLPAWR